MRSRVTNMDYSFAAQKTLCAPRFLCLFNHIYLVMSDFILTHTINCKRSRALMGAFLFNNKSVPA